MIIHVPLPQIEDNPFQARVEYGDIEELAADILRHAPTRPGTFGLQQVPSGRLVGDDSLLVPTLNLHQDEWLTDMTTLRPGWTVQLEFGHRRFRAFQYLCTETAHDEYRAMPVNILDLTDDDMLDGVWSENRARRDLSAVEEAELLAKKLATLNSQREVAEAWGLSRPVIANRLSLLNLPEEIQQANRDGRLSERQALALKPILEIQEKTGGKKIKGWYYDQPADYIQNFLSDPDKHTSDDIRKYANNLVRSTGTTIPNPISKLDCAAAPDAAIMTQPDSCKGCPNRVQQACFSAPCIQAKLNHFGRIHAQAAAQQLGCPYSDDWAGDKDNTFRPYNYSNDSQHLVKVFRNGGCDHLVVGWTGESGYWIRPLHPKPDGDGTASANDPYAKPDEGVILGHTGPIHSCLKALPDNDDHSTHTPDPDRSADDSKQRDIIADTLIAPDPDRSADDSKQRDIIADTLIEALVESLVESLVDTGPLFALLTLANWPGYGSDDDFDDPDLAGRRLVQHLQRFQGHVWNAFDAYNRAAAVLSHLSVPGRDILDQAIGETKAGALNARARRVLHFYNRASLHDRARRQEVAGEIQAVRDQYQEIGPLHDPEANQLIPWLERYAAQLAERMAPEPEPAIEPTEGESADPAEIEMNKIRRQVNRIENWLELQYEEDITPEQIRGNIINLTRLQEQLDGMPDEEVEELLYGRIEIALDALNTLSELLIPAEAA